LKGRSLAAIVAAGESKFGKLEGRYAREIFADAVDEAFEGSPKVDRRDIQALFVGQMSDYYEHQGHSGPIFAEWAGLENVPAFRLEGACASSGLALAAAIMAIGSGRFETVMVGGVEKMTHRSTADVTEILSTASDFPTEQWNGLTFPGAFALIANAHMDRYGTTEEQLARVAVKNHRCGALNPKAHMAKEVTLEQALSSRMIAYPLKLFDCSLISDGAAALILTSPEAAKKYTDIPVHIVGSGQASDTIGLWEREDLTGFLASRLAARRAYEMAGLKPRDIDVAEVHDCFTIAEIVAYEDLRLCGKGEGGRLIDEGATEIHGRIPVNTSGGLKSKGHPVGATGAGQVYEMYRQLLGEAGRMQVEGAETALCHNLGGSGATCAVHILRRGD